jgi:hypothetical protein
VQPKSVSFARTNITNHKRHIDGKEFHLAAEIEYIQRRAAEHDGRFVTVGPLALFSTDTVDAWLLDGAASSIIPCGNCR